MNKVKFSKYISSGNVLDWEFFSNQIPQDHWDEIVHNDELEFDMSDLGFLKPDGVIWLYFIFKYRKLRNFESYLILPSNPKQVAYLKYLGLRDSQHLLGIELLNPIKWMTPGFDLTPKEKHLLNLKDIEFVTSENAGRIKKLKPDNLRDYLIDRYDLKKNTDEEVEDLYPLIETIREYVQNIGLHGGESHGNGHGFCLFTPYSNKEKPIRICFNDVGRGFKTTLLYQHDIKCEDDTDAIFKGILLRHKKRRPLLGVGGIITTLPFIRKKNGIIGFRSGDTLVSIDLSTEKNQRIFDTGFANADEEWLRDLSETFVKSWIPGSHIFIELQ